MNGLLNQIADAKNNKSTLGGAFLFQVEFEGNQMTLAEAIQKMDPSKLNKIHMGGRPMGKTAADHKKYADALLNEYAMKG